MAVRTSIQTKVSMRRVTTIASGALVFSLLAACGGKQAAPEKVIVEEPKIKDIPGVQPAAMAAFNAGLAKLNQTPKDYVGALGSFQTAVSQDPNFWEAVENVGLLQIDLAQYDAAAQTFREELRLIEDLAARGWPVERRVGVHMNLGRALALGGRTREAATEFAKVLEQNPKDVDAKANLAAVYVQEGDFTQARAFIAELLQANQNEPGALNVLALIYKRENNMPMAQYLWEKCTLEIQAKQQALSDEAQYRDLSEADAERLRRYNETRLVRLSKQLSDVQNELGVVEAAAKRADQAESFFKKAVENNPSNSAAYINLGAVYLDYANFADACSSFEEALALRPRDLTAMVGFASCTYGLGEVDAAFAAFERTAQAFPDNAFVAKRLGEIAFRDKNDQATAMRWFGVNLSIRGTSADVCDQRADEVCSTLKALIQMQQSQQPRAPEAGGEEGK